MTHSTQFTFIFTTNLHHQELRVSVLLHPCKPCIFSKFLIFDNMKDKKLHISLISTYYGGGVEKHWKCLTPAFIFPWAISLYHQPIFKKNLCILCHVNYSSAPYSKKNQPFIRWITNIFPSVSFNDFHFIYAVFSIKSFHFYVLIVEYTTSFMASGICVIF